MVNTSMNFNTYSVFSPAFSPLQPSLFSFRRINRTAFFSLFLVRVFLFKRNMANYYTSNKVYKESVILELTRPVFQEAA